MFFLTFVAFFRTMGILVPAFWEGFNLLIVQILQHKMTEFGIAEMSPLYPITREVTMIRARGWSRLRRTMLCTLPHAKQLRKSRLDHRRTNMLGRQEMPKIVPFDLPSRLITVGEKIEDVLYTALRLGIGAQLGNRINAPPRSKTHPPSDELGFCIRLDFLILGRPKSCNQGQSHLPSSERSAQVAQRIVSSTIQLLLALFLFDPQHQVVQSHGATNMLFGQFQNLWQVFLTLSDIFTNENAPQV